MSIQGGSKLLGKQVSNFFVIRIDNPSISREGTGLFAVRICFISFQKSLYLLCVIAVTHFSLRSSLRLSLNVERQN